MARTFFQKKRATFFQKKKTKAPPTAVIEMGQMADLLRCAIAVFANGAAANVPPPPPPPPPPESPKTPDIEKGAYIMEKGKLDEEMTTWNEQRAQRFSGMIKNLENLSKFRFQVKDHPYGGEKDAIDECFDDLLADRAKIDAAIYQLKKDCRIRGFSLMSAQAVVLGGFFTSFVRNVLQRKALNWGLGVFITLVCGLALSIVVHLQMSINETMEALNADFENLVLKTAARVEPFAVRIYEAEEFENLSEETKTEGCKGLSDCKRGGKDIFPDEERIVNLLKKILQPIDSISSFKWSVGFEMLGALVFIVFLAVITRIFLALPIPK